MSRIAWLAAVCGLALTATPGFVQDAKNAPAKKADPAEVMGKALNEKVGIDGTNLSELTLAEGLVQLSKQHGIPFVVQEEDFKKVKLENIKNAKSALKGLDTKELTLRQFLDVWLASLGARYNAFPDHVYIYPLRPAAHTTPGPKPDSVAVILAVLDEEFVLREGTNINEIPLIELLTSLSKKWNQSFVINEDAFKQAGIDNVREVKPTLSATQLSGMPIRQVLALVLDSMGATYLVKNGTIEIVPMRHAAKVTKSEVIEAEDGRVRLAQPLVSAVVKEKPLNEAVAKIAEAFDLNVIVSPQAGDAKAGFVSARLVNVPADKALDLLAVQCDLRVVRKGNAFLITTKEQANELFNEKLDKERQKIEVEKLREAPAAPPAPPAKPEKPPMP